MTKFKDFTVQKLMWGICPWELIETLPSLFLEVIINKLGSLLVIPQGQMSKSNVF